MNHIVVPFAALFLGHLVGDFLCQNDWMALNKTKPGWMGTLAALVHCIIYTVAMCEVMQDWRASWMALVFLSHYPIDRYRLADYLIKWKGNKTVTAFLDNRHWNDDHQVRTLAIEAGFNAVVYVAIDNTLHLLIMYYGYMWLGGFR